MRRATAGTAPPSSRVAPGSPAGPRRGGGEGGGGQVGVGHEDGDLVAADPEGSIRVADGRADEASGGRQDLVAAGMTALVVHPPEGVEIEQGARERSPANRAPSPPCRDSSSWKARWFPRPVNGSITATSRARSYSSRK